MKLDIQDQFALKENSVLWKSLKNSRLPYLNPIQVSNLGDERFSFVLRDLEEYQISHPRMRNIPAMVGQLLNILIKLSKPKVILDIGTANGYSALWLGLAAREVGGHVLSYEKFDWKVDLARDNIVKAGLQDTVSIYLGDALYMIKNLRDDIDFALLDIWSGDYVDCFEAMRHGLHLGSVLVADNIVAHRDREGVPIINDDESDAYISLVRNTPGLTSAFMPIGSGLEITYVGQNWPKE